MKSTIRLEEAAMLLLSIVAFYLQIPYAWWVFPACILLPDLSMVGYAAGNKTGAAVYNFFHHRGVAILVYLAGYFWHQDALMFTGMILFGHAAMDRLFGYGLKYETGFKFTHLGEVGKHK